MPVVGKATIAASPTRYEYEVIERSRHDVGRHELVAELNHLGKEGWLYVGDHEDMLILARPLPPPPRQAVTGTVSVVGATTTEGDPSMAQLTVDSAGNAKFQFDDDHGDIVAPPQGDGSGIVVTFTSDDPGVANFGGAASANGVAGTDDTGLPQYLAPLTFGVDGAFNLSAEVSNVSEAPLVDDDGSTPFVQAQPVNVPVAGGQATTGTTSAD